MRIPEISVQLSRSVQGRFNSLLLESLPSLSLRLGVA